jgi:ATP-dependent DNA ligase
VIDGEAVIWSQGRLNFTALQQRLGAGPKGLPGRVLTMPASYAAFDVLAVAGHDALDLPLHKRRALPYGGSSESSFMVGRSLLA